jgi:hypothetical protein
MQLQFTRDELKLLADILNNSENRAAETLLDRVLTRDLRFGFDELEDLADILRTYQDTLPAQIGGTKEPERKRQLQRQQRLLAPMVDKVTEACAMA